MAVPFQALNFPSALEFSFASPSGLLKSGVHKILWTILGFCLCGFLLSARADTFPMADGSALSGDIISFNDAGVILRLADGKYTDRIPWTSFSQDGLKQLAHNPKIKPLTEPFIEIPLSARPQKPKVVIQEVTRLELPPKQSLIGALCSSSVGIFALLLIYAANIYAGYEVAIVRARPKGLVMGVAAALPFLGPIIFLAMPVQVVAAVDENLEPVDPTTFAVPGQAVTNPDEIHVSSGSWQKPATGQVFQRGQFTFNRRFIETKFAGFFGATRTAADNNNLFIVKTTNGEFIIERITRVDAADMHVEIMVGENRQVVMLPFADIQEIRLKPKDA